MTESIDKQLLRVFKNLPKYEIEIGVFAEKTKRKHTLSVGLTNAELMFVHEQGSPLHNVPARPVLHMTIQWAHQNINNAIQKALKAYTQNGIDAYENELKKFCLRMENYARKIIYSNDGRLAPNAPSVAKRKGGNHPLFDTGQLARSITCKLVKI